MTFPAPDWFVNAKLAGASADELRAQVQNYCRHLQMEDAAKEGTPPPTSEPDPLWVDLMYDMYHSACAYLEGAG